MPKLQKHTESSEFRNFVKNYSEIDLHFNNCLKYPSEFANQLLKTSVIKLCNVVTHTLETVDALIITKKGSALIIR